MIAQSCTFICQLGVPGFPRILLCTLPDFSNSFWYNATYHLNSLQGLFLTIFYWWSHYDNESKSKSVQNVVQNAVQNQYTCAQIQPLHVVENTSLQFLWYVEYPPLYTQLNQSEHGLCGNCFFSSGGEHQSLLWFCHLLIWRLPRLALQTLIAYGGFRSLHWISLVFFGEKCLSKLQADKSRWIVRIVSASFLMLNILASSDDSHWILCHLQEVEPRTSITDMFFLAN